MVHCLTSKMVLGPTTDHRISDNLFVLLQLIEIAHKKKKPLYLCFLDIKGAFDNVNREILWQQLSKCGATQHSISILRAGCTKKS